MAEAPPHEQRCFQRRRVLRHIQVMGLDKQSTSVFNASLRNISRSGAMLSGPASSIAQLPGQFYLVPPGQLRLIRCKTIWKTYGELGIRFVSDAGTVLSALAPAEHNKTEQRNAAEAEPLVASATAEEIPLPTAPTAKIIERHYSKFKVPLLIAIGALALLGGIALMNPWPLTTTLKHIVASLNCNEARAMGLAPAYRGEPGYRFKQDRDSYGRACGSGRGYSIISKTSNADDASIKVGRP